MKNFTFTIFIAFLLSLLLHFLFYETINQALLNTHLQIPTTNKISKNHKRGYTDIKFVKLIDIQKEIKIKKTIKKKIVKKNLKIKKVIKKKIVKKQQKPITKTTKQTKKTKKVKKVKIVTIPKQQIDLKQFFVINKIEQQSEPKQEISSQEEMQNIQQELNQIKNLDEATQEYIKLYGKQYFKFSKIQKRYIINNISTIGRITQRHLRYPKISIRTRQKGINVVEFLFYPNGDISNLEITDTSHYTALDKNTLKTIKIAYKDYPRPTQTVKIKINVKYILY